MVKRRIASLLSRMPAVIPPIRTPNTPDAPPPKTPGDTTPGTPKPPPGNNGPNTPSKPDPLTPKPVQDGATGPVCLAPVRRSRIFGRTTYTKADANDPNKVLQFMNEHRAYYEGKGIMHDKLVFFASGSDGAGKRMAQAFVNFNVDAGYANFNDLFLISKYNAAFGVDPERGEPAKAASKAMALYAKNPVVFNSGKGMNSMIYFTANI
jgi:hypothetical protein